MQLNQMTQSQLKERHEALQNMTIADMEINFGLGKIITLKDGQVISSERGC